MVAVKEFSWEEVSSPDFGSRAAWRAAVADIADKARAKLPECNGRVDKAVAIVLAGDVELMADGTAKVASQSNGTAEYLVVNGECTCKDFAKAPLDAPTTSQAEPPRQPPLAQPAAPTAPLPEAPVSITLKATLHGHEVLVTLRGVDFASVKAQVEQASEWLRVQTPAQSPTQSTEHPDRGERPGWCSKHGVQMAQNHKDGRSWWSHKTAEGWCKGK